MICRDSCCFSVLWHQWEAGSECPSSVRAEIPLAVGDPAAQSSPAPVPCDRPYSCRILISPPHLHSRERPSHLGLLRSWFQEVESLACKVRSFIYMRHVIYKDIEQSICLSDQTDSLHLILQQKLSRQGGWAR